MSDDIELGETSLNRNTQRKKLGRWRTLLRRHQPLKRDLFNVLREVTEQSKASICVHKAYTIFFFF